MVDQYFVHYLLNKGLLTPVQMHDALEQERSVRVKMGIWAINASLLTAAQVEEIHLLQRVQDKKFGTLAMERGYLTGDQLEHLLTLQGQENLAFLQAVADKGILTLSELDAALLQYLKGKGITREAWLSRNNDREETIVKTLLDFSAQGEYAEYFYSYVGLLLRNIVRFLDGQPMVLPPGAEGGSGEKWVVLQGISGAVNIGTTLVLEEAVLIELASRFSGELLTSVDELALDCAGEFLNVHNGIYLGTLSQAGLDVDLQPQTVHKEEALTAYSRRIAIGTSFGVIVLVMS